ncbi:bacteriohemerythrin [Colwellia sp. E2M01]|uniref:bacteriohemerythrin n=1 Tax=Colwellia sp. E2M01 TaxID=2841561 RepID=UPI001C08DFC7|nr:bacteriohemerythrin [Colwellia sp. E2M01]MBU2869807.1 bacteriohemerythrin [Colwellia sp. E2M01]
MTFKTHPDVIMIYQDKETVEPAIQQIVGLSLKFKAYKYNPETIHKIAAMSPKVLLLASNNVKRTIKYYIDYLEDYEQNISPHRAILLINNRETSRAYLACENGLFDNYVISNPLNEPQRLKLVLLQELKLIENHQNHSLEQLVLEGEDELASCIEHGVVLKKSFIQEVTKCEVDILSATNQVVDINKEAKEVLQNLIGVSLDEMNESVSSGIQNIVDQLIQLKANSQSIKQGLLHSQHKQLATNKATEQDIKKKVLIAEPSNLFTRVIKEIFEDTLLYELVNDGQDAIEKINNFKPDAILLAYDLPTVNGIEITKLIRSAGNKVPIIAYVHEKDKLVIKQWIPLGLNNYLIKPSRKSKILQSVNKAISNPSNIIFHKKAADKTHIEWIPEYSVGNQALDEQHKVLFTMVNEFLHEENKQGAIALYQNLSLYIDLHFDAEENLLRQINYPDTEDHIKKHAELREKFNLLETKLENYDVDIHHKIAIFLYNWLANHILKSDMEYKHYALSIEESSFIE